jgi:pre-mRNA-processing factor SLU7
MQTLQLFAWQANARGNDVHLNANPTQGELLHHEYREKKEELKGITKVSILAKYGGAKYLEKAPTELLQGQTEEYVEYSRSGQVVKGNERVKARSKYPEDGMSHLLDVANLFTHECWRVVFTNNHTAIWGSWYDVSTQTWGYGCCHSTIHLSYCAGEAAIDAVNASSVQNLLSSSSSAMPPPPLPSTSEKPLEKPADAWEPGGQNFSKKRVGEGDVKLDKERLALALQEEKKRKMRGEDDDERMGKKKKAGLAAGHEVTEEELGAFIFYRAQTRTSLISICRGVPNAAANDGGSHGELCRWRCLNLRLDVVSYYYRVSHSLTRELLRTEFILAKAEQTLNHRRVNDTERQDRRRPAIVYISLLRPHCQLLQIRSRGKLEF